MIKRIAGPKPWGGGTVVQKWTAFDEVEIRLTDVLLAINADINNLQDGWMITAWGAFYKTLEIGSGDEGYEATKDRPRWNLKDDNLDHQSDECKQFLISLLVK